jgi:hypothetical protein
MRLLGHDLGTAKVHVDVTRRPRALEKERVELADAGCFFRVCTHYEAD